MDAVIGRVHDEGVLGDTELVELGQHAPPTITLNKTTSGTIAVSGIFIISKGDFAQTNQCGNTLGAGASCAISVTFKPTGTGTRTGTLYIGESAASNAQSVQLTGTGVMPVAGLAPNSLVFGSQAVGSTSAPQAVTLTNTGNLALTVSKIAASGDFAETNNCGSSVSAGASCAITVTFIPAGAGPRNGTLTIVNNAPDSPQHIALSGTGQGPAARVSPAFLLFGPQTTGSTSAPQTVTLTNTGTAALAVSNIAASGDFAETNNCGSSVNAGPAARLR